MLLQPQRLGNNPLRVHNSGRRGSTSDGKPPFLVCAPLPLPGLSSQSPSPPSLQSLHLFSPSRRSDGVMVRNCCRGSFLPHCAWTAFLARALVSWSDFVPLSVLSPYFFDFSFSRKALRFSPALGVSRLHLVAILVGKNRRDFAFLVWVRAFQLVTLCFLALVIAVRFWLGFGRPRLLRSCSLNPWRCEIQLVFLDSV